MSDEVVVNVESLVATAAAALEAGNGAGGHGAGVATGAAAPPTPVLEGAVPEIRIFIENPGSSFSGTENDGVVQCKICHDEGLESEMETPCGCDGTIRFAHRKCVQTWIDLKGDIICEICHQEYRPDYSVLPESEAYRRLNNEGFLALSDSENEENNWRLRFWKFAGYVVMMLLFIRYLLMIVVDTGRIQDSTLVYFQMYVELSDYLLPGYMLLRTLFLMMWRGWRRALD
ncbi:E3 ubiquitin-protein ligase MARCH8-like [Cocos nucifera]|nr:E3 ubiquitin-protein ligase MARCH8-like [Cocos nucifera]